MKVSFFKSIWNRNDIQYIDIEILFSKMKSSEILKSTTDSYREEIIDKNKAEISEIKAKTFSSMIPAGIFGGTGSDKDIQELSGLIVLDYDHIDDVNEMINKFTYSENVYAIFTSPSNAGIKVFVKHDLKDVTKWKSLFNELSFKFNKLVGCLADASGKNISRMCYIPYSEDIYLNEEAKEYHFKNTESIIIKEYKKSITTDKSTFEKTEITDTLYLECFYKSVFIKDYKINLVEDYNDWLSYGFSLAVFGEDGRAIFHNLSSVSDKYDKDETNHKFDNFLKDFNGNRSGVEKYISNSNSEITKFIREILNNKSLIPSIDFYDKIPNILNKTIFFEKDLRQKFMGFLSSLTVFSSIMPNYHYYYWNKYKSPNIFLWIAANSGSGKNMIDKSGKILSLIIDKFKKDYKKEIAIYLNNKRDAENDLTITPLPHPKKHGVQVGSDSTKAALIKFLNNNQTSIVVAPEAKSMLSANKTQYGNFLDVFLLCFENESITKNILNEEFNIEKPKLSLLFASTKQLIYDFFATDNIENGLFSRFLSFDFYDNNKSDSFSSINIDASIQKISDDYLLETQNDALSIFDGLSSLDRNVECFFTNEQILIIDAFMDKLKKRLIYVYNQDGVIINRWSDIFRRIIMVLTMLREYEHSGMIVNYNFIDRDYKITPLTSDIELAKQIFNIYEFNFIELMDGINKTALRNIPAYKRDDKITTLYYEGEPIHKIANYFDMPINKIKNIIRKYDGFKTINPKIVQILSNVNAMKTDEIAKLLGVTQRYIQNIIKKLNENEQT